jgi:hypothetical protein
VRYHVLPTVLTYDREGVRVARDGHEKGAVLGAIDKQSNGPPRLPIRTTAIAGICRLGTSGNESKRALGASRSVPQYFVTRAGVPLL